MASAPKATRQQTSWPSWTSPAWTMSEQRSRMLALGSGRPTVEVIEAGQGPNLLFLHGAGGVVWAGALPILAQHFHVYAPVLPGFGKLVKMHRKERMGRNPATGQPVKIAAKTVVKFRLAKAMKDSVL